MRNLEIKDDKLEIYEDEQEKLEKFVKDRKGQIVWGFIKHKIEEGKTYIEYLPWVTKTGFMLTKLSDID